MSEEYGEAFQMFDKDGDGRITRDELAAMMAKFGEEVSDEELNNIMASTDTNNDGGIDFEEFAVCMSKWASPDADTQLRECFKIFDKDNSGTITSQELRTALSKIMNEHWSDEVIDELIREADLDGNGEIDYEEFYKVMKLYEIKQPV